MVPPHSNHSRSERKKTIDFSAQVSGGEQAALVLSWLGLPYSYFCLWTWAITVVLLLFVMPWFWAGLRHVALFGWLLAVISVLSFALRMSGNR